MTIQEEFKQFLEEKANRVTKKDFNSFLKSILEAMKKKEDAFTQKFNLLLRDIKDSTSEFRNVLKTCKEMVAGELKKFQEKHEKRMGEMMAKMDEMEAGKDEMKREMALEAHRMTSESLLPQIPTLEQLEQKLPMLGEQVASSLELLPKEKKLALEAIKGLREELDEIRALRTRAFGGGGTSDIGVKASMARIVQAETPSGDINGVNLVYTVSSNINAVLSFGINGMVIHDTEYSFVNKTITFVSAIPASLSGTNFRITYV